MTDESTDDKDTKKPKEGLGERVRDHLRAAEVAAEEAAGYGWATEAVEATEAAVDPEHELGKDDKRDADDSAESGDTPYKEDSAAR